MRGLLLKDLYMTAKYCRAYLLLAVIFIAVSFFNGDNFFFAFYPCLLCGMIPVNLLAYDERSRWQQYSETMPYTKAQIVSGKYLIGIGAQLTMLLLTGIAQAIRMSLGNTFVLKEYMVLMMLLPVASFLSAAICLPFIFRMGVEKGRMAYYFMIGIACAISFLASDWLEHQMNTEIELNAVLPILCLISVGVYALSWYLSVVLYKKRELFVKLS